MTEKESKFTRFFLPIVPKPLRPLFIKYQEYISYLFFGALTTLVNFILYYPLCAVMNYLVANIIAWIGSVIFAYVTNKIFVFESDSKGCKAIVTEIAEFFGARLLSLGMEELILWLMAGRLSMNEKTVKIIAAVLVVIFNYFASKFVIFRKKKDKDGED